MANWTAKEFDWTSGRYTGRYYDIAQAGIVRVFVDSFYGADTNAGTAASPFRTLSRAIPILNTTGANGSCIFMNGIFSETLPTQTYTYRFIGCGGGRYGRTVFYRSSLGVQVSNTNAGVFYENIELLNYNNNNFSSVYFSAVNSFIKNTPLSWFSGVTTLTQGFHFSIFKNVGSGGFAVSFYYNCLLLEIYGINTSNRFNATGLNNFYLIDPDRPFVNISTGNGCLRGIEPQFINYNENDFNVRITSPLIGAGTVDEITGIAANVGGVEVGLPYNGIVPEFTTEGGATITDLTIDSTGRFTITAPATTGSLETALMDLGNIYPLENIDLFNIFDFASGEITQGVFEDFVSPRMALTIKLKYGLTSAEVDDCPWLLIEYGKQPTFSRTGASRVGNAADTFDPDTFQTITCRYMKLFVTLQNNS